MTSSTDRYSATYVVAKDLGPPDGRVADFTDIQAAIAAIEARSPEGGKIFVKAGTYHISSTIRIKTSNIQIQGEGMGITVIEADSAMTGDTPALAAGPNLDGLKAPLPLQSDAVRGTHSIQVSPAVVSSVKVGDDVLLYSDKSVDTERATKHAGELKRVVAVAPTTGVITLDDQIFDTYTRADSAHVVPIPMLRNITLSDISITTKAGTSNLKVGFTHFRFVENLQIDRLEVHDAFHSGIQLQSVRNSAISGCYIHHISDVVSGTPGEPANLRYGIWVGDASQNVSISGSRFSHTRHAVTTGGSSGPYHNGVQRNIVVANCTSMLSDTAHFDTHQPAENVTFIGCVADGGVPAVAGKGVYGFQMRGRNGSIIGCSVLQAIGRGVMIFGPVSSGAVISGNMIANVKALPGMDHTGRRKNGTGIYFDSGGTSNHSVTGNVIKNCEGSAIDTGGSNQGIVITGNVINNVNSVVPGAAVQLREAAGSVVENNVGYNPVGRISNPWPATGTDLTNHVESGIADPRSTTVYTVRHTPKTIVVARDRGDVSKILINGADTGSTAGAFKLGVGETIAMTFVGPAPTTAVFAE